MGLWKDTLNEGSGTTAVLRTYRLELGTTLPASTVCISHDIYFFRRQGLEYEMGCLSPNSVFSNLSEGLWWA